MHPLVPGQLLHLRHDHNPLLGLLHGRVLAGDEAPGPDPARHDADKPDGRRLPGRARF